MDLTELRLILDGAFCKGVADDKREMPFIDVLGLVTALAESTSMEDPEFICD